MTELEQILIKKLELADEQNKHLTEQLALLTEQAQLLTQNNEEHIYCTKKGSIIFSVGEEKSLALFFGKKIETCGDFR